MNISSLKGGIPLVNILKGIIIFAGTRPSGSSIKFCFYFARYCHTIAATQGIKGLVRNLKAQQISLQQALGGHHLHDVSSLGCRFARTSTGIPRLIPVQFRIRIRQGDARAIRMSLTLLGMYRVLKFPGKLNLATITAPSAATGALVQYIRGLIPLFVRLFVLPKFTLNFLQWKLWGYAKVTVLPMFKGGPGAPGHLGLWNTHPIPILRAIFSLRRDPVLWEAFQTLCHLTGNRTV